MKRVILFLTIVSVLLSAFPIFCVNGDNTDVSPVLINGDFEGVDSLLYKSYADLVALAQDGPTGWYQYNQASALVKVVSEPENSENSVLSMDNVAGNWFGVVQCLPVERTATGNYNISFKVKNAGTSAKASVSVRLSFLIKDNTTGGISRASNSPYRPVTYGGDSSYNTAVNFDVVGDDWNVFDFDVDVIPWTGTKSYINMFDETAEKTVVGIMVEIRPNFAGGNTSGTTPSGDYQKTMLYVDDVAVTAPSSLTADISESVLSDVNFKNAVIPVSFNYTDGIYGNSLGNITVEDNYGNKVECTAQAEGGTVNVNIPSLKPSHNYTLKIDKVVSSTPVPEPSTNPTENAKENRYVTMENVQSFNFNTISEFSVTGKTLSSGTAGFNIINNSNTPTDVYAVVFEKNNGAVDGSVYIKKVSLTNNSTPVTVSGTGLETSDYNVEVLRAFGGSTDSTLAASSKLNIDFSSVNQNLKYDGFVDKKYAGDDVTLLAVLPDAEGDFNEIPVINGNETAVSNIFLNIEKITVDADGKFAANEINVTKSGMYRVIGMIDGKVFADEKKYFASKTDSDNFLNSVNLISSDNKAEDLFEILETEHTEQKIRFDETYYNMLSDDSKKLMCINLAEGIEFGNIDLFKAAFADETLRMVMLKEQSAQKIAGILNSTYEKETPEKVSELIELDSLKNYSTFEDYKNSSEKEQMCENFAAVLSNNPSLYTPKQYADCFNISVINYLIAQSSMHKDISAILDSHSDVLTGLNLGAYKNLGLNQSSVNESIKLNPKNSLEDFVKYVNLLVSNSQNPNPGGGIGGGGAGGGGSGGSKPSVVTPNNYQTFVSTENSNVIEKDVFKDTDSVKWAKEAIEKLYARKIISGKGEFVFDPNSLITREEFVKIIIGAMGLEPIDATDDVFDDVKVGSWYAGYVAAAVENGITKGIGDNSFGTGLNITRQDMFVMCGYLVDDEYKTETNEISKFADSDKVADYAYETINRLVGLGLINGDGVSLNPTANATRAEAAKIIYDILVKTGNF